MRCATRKTIGVIFAAAVAIGAAGCSSPSSTSRQAAPLESPATSAPAVPSAPAAGQSGESTAQELAKAKIALAEKEEPSTTKTMVALSTQLHGRMVGLDFSIKSEKSLTEKIITDAQNAGVSEAEAAANIHDVLRYTAEFDTATYTPSVNHMIGSMKQENYTQVRLKNTWPAPGSAIPKYIGINTLFNTPSQYTFELQFHTPQSFVAKQETHGLYEEARKLDPKTQQPAIDELNRKQAEINAAIPVPPRAWTIG